ncbi:MAG TPA: hypothetical protein VG297_03380 [Bryobacteraceae bacterium]|nr:hypothetical protein [Bryobacteraceae bacterium]
MAAAVLLCGLTAGVSAQEHARGVIDRTQTDLQRAADFERHRHGTEVERYENAQKHLSDFDREFTRGNFDKGKLDTAIDDVKNVVDHNSLNPADRDALRDDLSNLRSMREEHDRLRHD